VGVSFRSFTHAWTTRVRRAVTPHLGWALKSALAGVLAWLVARSLVEVGTDFYAPLVAVLSVHPTVARTLRDAAQRLLGVVLGLALGFVALQVADLHWWSMAAVLVVAMSASTWRGLGEEGVQVPIAALLMLVFADDPATYAEGLVVEGLVGVVAAATVNLLVVPPLHVRTAEQAISRLRRELGDVLDRMSSEVGSAGWPPERLRWSGDARRLEQILGTARDAVEAGSESVRWNVRARPVRALPESQRQAVIALERVTVGVREMGRLLTEAAAEDHLPHLNDLFRPRLADVLRKVATAVSAAGRPDPSPDAAAQCAPLEEAEQELRTLQHQLISWEPPELPSLLAEGALVTQLRAVVRDLREAAVPADQLTGVR
jgi:hypothetical protein